MLMFFKNNWMPKFNRSLSTTKLVLEIFYSTFECFPFMILNDRVDIILLQVPLAKSICLSETRFIIWKQEGLRGSGRSLRMTLYKGIAKHSSSQSPAMMFN